MRDVIVCLGVAGQLLACAHANPSQPGGGDEPARVSMVEPCPEVSAPLPSALALSGTVWSVERSSGTAHRYAFLSDGTMETTTVGGLLNGAVLKGVIWRQRGACATLSFNDGFTEERLIVAPDGQTISGLGANIRGKKWDVHGRRGQMSPAGVERMQIRDENVARLVDGQSTRNDVLLMLGAPSMMESLTAHPNRETWVYFQQKAEGRFAITVVMENGVVVSHTRAAAR